VARVLDLPLDQSNMLAKLVPDRAGISLKRVLTAPIDGENSLRDKEGLGPEDIDNLKRLREFLNAEGTPESAVLKEALILEGSVRGTGIHAAGIIIAPKDLTEIIPVAMVKDSDLLVTQYEGNIIEDAGVIKMDFLGLKTLTIIRDALLMIKQNHGVSMDIDTIPLDDPKTYEMLARGETVGVFQVESAGMRKALVEMKADRIEDLIALVALYRPGPMDNIPTYCRRKLGLEQASYIHPALEPYLSETHGIIVYQEQVMQVAQALSGYSLGEADLLRRAMGKKNQKEMDQQRKRFVEGAVERAIPEALASEIFDLLDKFANYGFNKSHAAAYAIVSYQTAYLKANYPVEFMAASMTLDLSNTDKLAEFRRDAERMGITVEPPSINRSGVHFDVRDGVVHYALAAIRGVGAEAVGSIVSERERAGPFRDLADVARRLDLRRINKRTLEALIAAGALDELEPDRARATAAIDGIMALAQRTREAAEGGQNELFGTGAVDALVIPATQPWLASEKLQKEHAAVGFFLTGHPLDDYQSVLIRMRVRRFSEFAATVRQTGASMGRIAASVIDRSERRTKTGNKMGIVQLSDQSGHFEAVLFSEGLQRFRDLLEPGNVVLLMVSATLDGDEVKPRIESVEPLDAAAARQKQDMRIFLRDDKPVAALAERLRQSGDARVSVVVIVGSGEEEIEVELPGKRLVNPQIAGALRAVPGVVSVELS
jgi:DNA polymerase-3 subunit alpha